MERKEQRVSLWIMAAVITLCLCSNAFALEWGTKELDTEKLALAFSNQISKGGYKIVMTDELKAWIDKKEPMLLVDTMPFEDSYKKNHIPGAVQMEFPIEEMKELDAATKEKFEKLLGSDKNRKIVFYCGFTKCTRSHNAAMWAVKLGYTDVYRHPGGIKAWLEAGYPVEKSQ
jgi:thiosulfate/3-mercaptopyruvate sulfurtransferase